MNDLNKEDRLLIIESLTLRSEYCERLADDARESKRHRQARQFLELSEKLMRIADSISAEVKG